MDKDYLEFVKRLFKYYKTLGDAAIGRCSDKQLNYQFNEDSNSIKVIVHHVAGNMLSRWTDFLESDGEKDWRNRDSEFDNSPWTKTEIIDYWEQGWKVFMNSLESLTPEDLQKTIYIRNEGHKVHEAINRQLGHYPYHIGQMVYLAKMASQNWESLSIARNKSADFNDEKFSQSQKDKPFV